MSGFDELLAASAQLDKAIEEHIDETNRCAPHLARKDAFTGVKQLRMLLAKQHLVDANLKRGNWDKAESTSHTKASGELEDAAGVACMDRLSKTFLSRSDTMKNVWQMTECTVEEDAFKKQTAELFTELYLLEKQLKHLIDQGQDVDRKLEAVRAKWAELSEAAHRLKAESTSDVNVSTEPVPDDADGRRFEQCILKMETMRRLTSRLVVKSLNYKAYNWERDPQRLIELIQSYRRPITKDSFPCLR